MGFLFRIFCDEDWEFIHWKVNETYVQRKNGIEFKSTGIIRRIK